ncbi:MAG: ATP-binding protein [Saprospiraceae bacterium]|nr:ATP-binding protein [Pyrinomonadaceae bacterium]
MVDFSHKKVLADKSAADFIGRASETERLLRHAKTGGKTAGLILLNAPGTGASELLKQTYDKLYLEPSDVIPFYFSLNKNDQTAFQAARRFVQQFLLQTVAFRRTDPELLDISPEIHEAAELAIPSDSYWIDRVIEALERETDEQTFVRNAFGAPLRAAANGVRIFVMIDDLHLSANFEGGIDIAAELQQIYSRSDVPFVFACRRRFQTNMISFERLELEPFSFRTAGDLIESLAGRSGVKLNEQTRDLIAAQFDGNAKSIESILRAAVEKGFDLESFQKAEQVYADELFGGWIGKYYDDLFREIAPNIEVEKNIIGLLYDAVTLGNEKLAVEKWQKRLGIGDPEFARVLNLLNINEIIRVTSNRIEAMTENDILTDYLKVRFRLEIVGDNRALVFGESLSAFLKRAPQIMAQFYRENSSIGLRDLMRTFAGQYVPAALLDYSKFAGEYKGAPNDEILRDLLMAAETIKLPQIVFATHTADVYKPIEMVAEKDRSAAALGFQEKRYTDEDEIVWIAAQIDSKLEASRGLAEFWCDRLEMVALMCNFTNFKIWLVAPEGFSPDAVKLLQDRNSFGSSRKQFDVLKHFLENGHQTEKKPSQHEYEIVVPMGGEAELIAAHAVEEIAKRHHFDSKAINQIKTALVEACINASEHSLSPDQKIYQKFIVDDERLNITISNRGLRLADKTASEVEPDEERRGWGLKLMKKLMDEVKIEQTDDGTSISMTKYLKPVEQT